mgnify:CR=1 FL=1
MIILMVEKKDNIINLFRDKLYDQFPRSSRLNLNSKTVDEIKPYLNSRPILTSNWLVEINYRVSIKSIKDILQLQNINLITVYSNEDMEYKRDELATNGFKFTIFDNSKIAKEELIEHISKSLDIDSDLAKYIYNRSKGYVKDIAIAISVLSTLPNIDRKIIREYTYGRSSLGLFSVIDSLLGVSKFPIKSVVKVIYDYRYGFDFLLKFIIKQLEDYLVVYNYIEGGQLNLDNYKEFNPDDTAYKKISSYVVLKVIKLYSRVSKALLYFLLNKIKSINPSPYCIYELLMLLN